MKPIYDSIGLGYTRHRSADPRLAEAIVRLLGLSPPATLADIGAGTGNYSRAVADLGFKILAVEPSAAMHRQALPHRAVHWYSGAAEHIPLPDGSVDGIFCVLASHHFSSLEAAVIEMARICPAGPMVWFTFDPRQVESPWLRDYFPAVWERTFQVFPRLEEVSRLLEGQAGRGVTVTPWPLPHDLQDHFMASGWRRPNMYLDPGVRAGMSAFALSDQITLEGGLSRLERDLRTGEWKSKYGHLLEREAIDWGYRFLRAAKA